MYTQLILCLKYCFQRNFIFKNFIFRKFYLILKKKKKISKLLFIVDRPTLLFTGTVHGYCWSQYKNCIATHFQQPLVVLQYNSSLSHPIAIHFFMLQYNLTPSSKSQYNIVLQYKLSPQAFFSAIQYSVLQYNFPLFSSLLLCNIMTVLQYNFLYFKPSLQYNPAIQLSPLHCNTRNCIAI